MDRAWWNSGSGRTAPASPPRSWRSRSRPPRPPRRHKGDPPPVRAAGTGSRRRRQDVATHSEVGALAGGDRYAPAQEQLSVSLAERGTGLDREGIHLRVVVDARHQRRVDDDANRRVRHEAFEAVPSAAYRHPQLLPHRVLHGLDHLLGGADEAHVVGLARESLVESPADQVGVARVAWSDLVRTRPRAPVHRFVSLSVSLAHPRARSRSSSRSRALRVSAAARSNSTRASPKRPSFRRRSPRTLGKRW
jgi:hypothetical protein